jgi:TetR/AcrR family transcriptional regulator, cholesterol catabolism regulator
MATSTTERQERRHADRQRSILRAAAQEFAADGYERATLERIGDRVGLSKGSLYYYVNSKEELLGLLLEGVVDDILAQVPRDADPTVRLRRLIRVHVEAAVTPEGRVLVQNLDAIMGSAETARIRQRYVAAITDILTAGAATGAFRDVPSRSTVRFFLGALNAASRRFEPTDDRELAELVDLVTSLVLDGVARRP